MFKKLFDQVIGTPNAHEPTPAAADDASAAHAQPAVQDERDDMDSMPPPEYTTFENAVHDDSDPVLQPIHGITLQDYGAACAKLSNGIDAQTICKTLGVELPQWEEANTLWGKRMQEDGSFKVVNLFGRYFGACDEHPRLGALTAAPLSADAQDNLERLRSDRYFYEELCGARQAAYQYGLDGAQWVQDHYGIGLGDFQAIAMQWMTQQNQRMNTDEILHFANYMQEKQKEYAARFAEEQGGNVADDVNF